MVDLPLPKPSAPSAAPQPSGAAPQPSGATVSITPPPTSVQQLPKPSSDQMPAPAPRPMLPTAAQNQAVPSIQNPAAPSLPKPPQAMTTPAAPATSAAVPPAMVARPAMPPAGVVPPAVRPLTQPPQARPPYQQPQAAQLPQQPQQGQSAGVRPTVATGGNSPQVAKAPGGSKLKFIPIILGAVALLAVVIFAVMRFILPGQSAPAGNPSSPSTNSTAPTKQTVLTYWGLWEPSNVLDGVFDEFSQQNPGVIIQYQKQSPTQYRERLQSAIASGSGPDLFRFHASWVPMLRSELTAVPSSVMSTTEFQNTFYPIAVKQLTAGSQIVGIPLMYDGLGLYYNKQIFATAGLQPPTTWAELTEIAQTLTIRNSTAIERAGIALGTSTNVEHFSDVLGLLMIQNGADPSNPTSNEALQALTFYTNFATKYKVWDSTLPSSTVAFSRGDAAMMIAPSWRAHEVLAMNPDLEFDIISVPKLATEQVAWATFWAEGVSSQSKNKDLSWKLLKFLSSREVQQKMYADAAQTRAFGEIYARKDLASELITKPYVSAYLADAPYAQTWYLNSYTHDNGLNDQISKYYEDAITAIVSNTKSAAVVLETVAQGTGLVLRQFGLQSNAVTTTGAGSGSSAGAGATGQAFDTTGTAQFQ